MTARLGDRWRGITSRYGAPCIDRSPRSKYKVAFSFAPLFLDDLVFVMGSGQEDLKQKTNMDADTTARLTLVHHAGLSVQLAVVST